VLKKSFIGFLFLFMLLGCGEPSEVEMEIPIPGKLVYVEDFAGRHGVLAGRFGDLVLIDGNNNRRYALTDDHYYYAHPNLVNNGKEVWFESKRGDDLWPAGLGSRSDLYSLDVETRQVRNIRDSLSTVFGVPLELGISKFSVSPSDTRVVFSMRDRNNPDESSLTSFFHIDKDEQQLKRVENRLIREPIDHAFWSPDESKITYEMMIRYARVYTFDIGNNEQREISNDFIESSASRVWCVTGNWYTNNKFVYVCSNRDMRFNKIFIYDYEEGSSKEIAEIVKDNFAIRSLHISRDGSYLVFIGTTSIDFEIVESAIYVYNLETDEMESFAVNKREKRWMRWYEDL
jgi:hypothetical protein